MGVDDFLTREVRGSVEGPSDEPLDFMSMSYRGYNESFEGDVLNPLWFPHTTPAVRDYLLARGIDPFTKPASRPRKVFDPYEHKPLSSQMPQIITVHPDYRRGSVGPAS